jgi:hypothetical protein
MTQGSGGNQNIAAQAPTAGMAVFDINTGDLVGTVASVTSANSFTLTSPGPSESGASLLLSAYGGCGPADYYNSAHGAKSGVPSGYYWDNCIWGSRNVDVSGNTFSMNANAVSGCSVINNCGYMELMAFNAGVPKVVRYFDSYPELIAKAAGGLGIVWSNNKYSWSGSAGGGRWQFMAGLQGINVPQSQWLSSYHQDTGSSFSQ